MDEAQLVRTRHGLHGIAEYVLAGPQYALSRDIRLRVVEGGFATRAQPDLRVDGVELVTPWARVPLTSTFTELAAAAGVEVRNLRDVYLDGPVLNEKDPVRVDREAVTTILDTFRRGDAALRELVPGSDPVLWPEHFDVGIDAEEVNYGVSPGDTRFDQPYAYVGPWQPRVGDFWNADFGAVRPMTELPDVESVVRFFREGAEHARSDPPGRP